MIEWILKRMYELFGWPVPSIDDRIEFRGHWRRNRINAKMSTCDHYLDRHQVCRLCGKEFARLK